MKDKPVNLPASVLARLRNVARAKNTDYQLILRHYAIERLLYRLSISPQRDQFVLKGAMLFTAWLEEPFRPTQDVDLLRLGDPSVARIETVDLGRREAGAKLSRSPRRTMRQRSMCADPGSQGPKATRLKTVFP